MSRKASSMLLAKRMARERGILQKVERLRKARIEEAAADVCVRVKARAAAQQSIRDAEDDIGEALRGCSPRSSPSRSPPSCVS